VVKKKEQSVSTPVLSLFWEWNQVLGTMMAAGELRVHLSHSEGTSPFSV
jgi:hypothetical protein